MHMHRILWAAGKWKGKEWVQNGTERKRYGLFESPTRCWPSKASERSSTLRNSLALRYYRKRLIYFCSSLVRSALSSDASREMNTGDVGHVHCEIVKVVVLWSKIGATFPLLNYCAVFNIHFRLWLRFSAQPGPPSLCKS